jgi:sec-independent protein translocase protein TatB
MFEVPLATLLVLGLVALFVVGPDRLPAAAAWLGHRIRRAKQFATVASHQIHREVGPDFDQPRRPLAEWTEPVHELRRLRAATDPRRLVTDYLLNPRQFNPRHFNPWR